MDTSTHDQTPQLVAQARLHLSRAATHHDRGEVAELANSAWAAVVGMVAAVAPPHDLELDEIREVFAIANQIGEDTGDDTLNGLLARAHLLYWHSGDGCLTPDTVNRYFRDAAEFVTKMRAHLAQRAGRYGQNT